MTTITLPRSILTGKNVRIYVNGRQVKAAPVSSYGHVSAANVGAWTFGGEPYSCEWVDEECGLVRTNFSIPGHDGWPLCDVETVSFKRMLADIKDSRGKRRRCKVVCQPGCVAVTIADVNYVLPGVVYEKYVRFIGDLVLK